MQVTKVWEDCDFLNGEWVRRKVRSYWVQVNPAELDKVLAHSADPQALRDEIAANAGSDTELFFLISENLESIVNLPGYYPESGQWNGQSPFRDLEARVIQDLGELATL